MPDNLPPNLPVENKPSGAPPKPPMFPPAPFKPSFPPPLVRKLDTPAIPSAPKPPVVSRIEPFSPSVPAAPKPFVPPAPVIPPRPTAPIPALKPEPPVVSRVEPQREITPPPPKEVYLRTMRGDMESVAKGDALPKPQTVLPPKIEKAPVFPQEAALKPSLEFEESGSARKWIYLVLGLVVFAGLSVGGYYLLSSGFLTAPTTTTSPTDQPAAQIVTHRSYFLAAPADLREISLSEYDSGDILSAVKGASLPNLGAGQVRELFLKLSSAPASFNEYVQGILSGVFSPEAGKKWFADDFTAYLYYDANGVWPGYVVKVDPAIRLDELKAALVRLEAANLEPLYLGNPGQKNSFKDGSLFGQFPTRYAAFSAKGASFNYAVVRDYLVLSTSYDGLKAAARLLGISGQ